MYSTRTITAALSLILAVGASSCERMGATAHKRGSPDASTSGSSVQLLPLPFASSHSESTVGVKPPGVADIVERVVPSVVSISSTRVTRSRPSPHDDPFFRFFFGPGEGGPREQREQGLGSGVIVGEGIVVTNNHVVDQAENIKVTTWDNRQFDAKIIGADAKSDLAVLRLNGSPNGLKALPLGDANRLRLGDVVLAIGNPFGVGQTVTQGIVSAKNRSDLGIEDYEDFIQTDAAINPGNSGGALVDVDGSLVGINTAILSRSGGNVGIGFAIPSNMARPIIESLIAHGKVYRGWLGVAIQRLDYDMAKALNLPENSGVLVSDVTSNTPAAKAGMRRGDVITSVDEHKVRTTGELRNAIASAGANHTVRLKLLRDGKELSLSVPLAELPAKMDDGASQSPSSDDSNPHQLGMQLQPLTPELRSQLDVPSGVLSGVVVTEVDSASDVAQAGIRSGDVILEANRKHVASPSDLSKIWRSSQGNILLLVFRKGSTAYVVVRRTP